MKRTIKLTTLLTALLASGIASASSTSASTPAFTQEQNSAIEAQVKSYLDNNPKAVVDALVSYRHQEIQRMEEQAQNAIAKNAKDIFEGTNVPVLGNPNGSTVLVEFLDYQCGHCKQTVHIVQNLINQNKDLKVIIKELPILGETSNYAAKVALAANKQGKFQMVHEALLNNTTKLTKESVESIAKAQGVDWAAIEKSLESDALDKQLDKVFSVAQQLNIMGTPAFIVSDATGSNNRYFGGAASKETLQKSISEINAS